MWVAWVWVQDVGAGLGEGGLGEGGLGEGGSHLTFARVVTLRPLERLTACSRWSVTWAAVPRCSGRSVSERKGMMKELYPAAGMRRKLEGCAESCPAGLVPNSSALK